MLVALAYWLDWDAFLVLCAFTYTAYLYVKAP
jgi:hypothetical protein